MIRISAITAIAGAALGAVCLAAASPPPAPNPAPVTWNVNAGAGECTLTGSIPGASPTTLTLQTLTGSDSYRLVLSGPGLPAPRVQQTFPVTLLIGDQRFEQKARSAKLGGDRGNALILGGLGPDAVAALAQSTSITVESKGTSGPFALTHTKAATKALAGCVRDQLVEYGADAAQFQPGGKTPVALIPRDDWLSGPEIRRMLPSDGAVDAAFRVSVTPEGTVDDCGLVAGKPSARVLKIICDAVLTRKLFTPASDPTGKAVRGVALFEVHVRVVTGVTSETLEFFR